MDPDDKVNLIDVWLFGAIDVLRYKGFDDKEIAYTLLAMSSKYESITIRSIEELLNFSFDKDRINVS